MRHSLGLIAAATLIAACSQPPAQTIGVAAPPPPAPAPVVRPAPKSSANFRTATATIRDGAGVRIGTATFADSYAGLIVTGSVEGLGIGAHGIHIHEFGKCEAPFATAGSHFNPEKHKHGFKNADGPHSGDLPNIDVPPSGKLQFEFLLPDVTLRGGPRHILDAGGASIVIHSTRDDYLTDPAGNSGARLACGVIVQN